MRIFPFLIFLFLLPILAAARAGGAGDAFPNPARQPLLVVRLADPGAAEALLAGPQARALGLAGRDFSGRLPGLGAKVGSLCAFLAELKRAGAENIWFCLMQRGESILNHTAALGFELPAAPADFSPGALAGWLAERGLDAGGLAFEADGTTGGRFRLAMGRDVAALREALGGGTAAEAARDGWRHDLAAFLALPSPAAGAWVNPRPLLGLATLVGGPDFRAAAARLGLVVPDSLSIAFSPDGEDLGLALRLNNILEKPLPESDDGRLAFASEPEDAACVLTLAAPRTLLGALGWDRNPLAPANLDARALVPRLARLAWRPGADAVFDWQLACLMDKAPETRRSLDRLAAWLDVLAEAPPAGGLSAGRVRLPAGGEAHRLEWNGLSLLLGMAEAGGEAFLLAGSGGDCYPDVSRLSLTWTAEPRLLSWRFRLDGEAGGRAAAAFADAAGPYAGGRVDREAVRLLMEDDDGGVRAEGRALRLECRGGGAALALPFIARALSEQAARQRRDPARLAGERLRFLLGVANQYRYREVGRNGLEPGPWPRSLAELVFENDAAGRDWLDRSFPRFPGDGAYTTSEAIRHIASGRPAGGYRFALVDDAGGWRLEAVRADGGTLWIDRDGKVTER